jgi:hypothetical protein
MTERPMTFPELVDQYNAFLRQASGVSQVFIGIDELDKIESAGAAYDFLNDIKGIFGHDDCYYLISISENAMSSFERRGLPLRDAFDSAFDAVVDVGYMDLIDAERLLRRRIIGMPVGFLCLCYALSGGLPRDLIRVAREVVQVAEDNGNGAPRKLDAIAGKLLRNDLVRNERSFRAMGRTARLIHRRLRFHHLRPG